MRVKVKTKDTNQTILDLDIWVLIWQKLLIDNSMDIDDIIIEVDGKKIPKPAEAENGS